MLQILAILAVRRATLTRNTTTELPYRYIRNVPVIPTRGTTRYGYNNAPMWSLSLLFLWSAFKFLTFE